MAFDHDTAPKGASKAGAVKAAALNTAQADAMQAAQLAAPAARGGQAAVATKVVSAADGIVRLPAGAALDNVHAEGRDLVIQLPDGSQIVVTDGAVTVPQVMVGDVVVDAQNIIALLVGNEPQPAAGPPSSSGGNFAVALGDIGKGIAIGDLLPPTQLAFSQPDTREAFTLAVDEEPTVIIITPDNPVGAIAASQTVSEAGLPARGGESAGTAAGNGSNAASGTISFTPGNEPSTVTIDGHAAVLGATIASAHGVLTITSVAPGLIGYTYTLTDNIAHAGAADVASETFAVVVTDNDGDTASAALTINVMDDAPIARADTDGVVEDGVAIANGNVMTGVFTGTNADANATDVVDSQGADSAIVTGVAVGQVASASGSVGSMLFGSYGVLVLSANGNYVYTLNNNMPSVQHLKAGQTGVDTFTYTITDGDGDVATTTLTINVVGTNDAPVVGIGMASLSEEGLAGALADTAGSPDTTNATIATGTISIYDVDGDTLTTTLQAPATALTSGGAAVTWTGVGTGALIGSAGGVEVVRVTITTAGAYTVSLSGPLDQAAAGEDAKSFTVPVSVSDGAVTSTGSLTVIIEDDSPTVTRAEVGLPPLTVDESNLSANATASFASVFTTAFGADGPAAAGAATYALGVGAGVTGLVDTATGSAVVLTLEAGQVVGRAGVGGAIVFTVAVAADGSVILDQQRAVVHADANNADDAKGLAAADLVTLTVTVTDKDGDHASAGANIGQTISFKDDGPAITVANAELPTLTVDESNLAGNATANFAGAFTAAFGADGAAAAGALTFALAIKSAGVASGLVDTTTGQAVVLTLEAGQVVGRAGAAGPVVFIVQVDTAGVVTLDQQRPVVHTDPSNANDGKGLAAADLIALTATITDKDGDHASASTNIGAQLTFLDDGPAITAGQEIPSLTVDESNLAANATVSFAGAFTAAFGADGPAAMGAVTYALGVKLAGVASGLVDTATGQTVILTLEAGQVVGRAGAAGPVVFIVQVDATGAVTLDQQRAVVHADANNANDGKGLAAADLIALTATITDKDGDHASASTNIGARLTFLDDGPAITAGQEIPSLTVDESHLAANATVSFAGAFTAAFGADGPAAADAVTYALGVNAGASGLVDTASGQAVALTLEAGQVVGRAGAAGPVVFIVTLAADGSVTLDQQRAVVHPDGSNANDSVTLAAANLITVTATATDKDGDHASASIDIGQSLSFADDAPHAANDAAAIAEGDIAPVAGNVLSNDAAGADAQPHVVAVGGLAANVGANLTLAHGTLILNADGSYSYALNNADPAVNGLTDGQTLTETVTYAMADADGDTSPATLTITINGVNDAPVIGNALATVSEEGLATGLPDGAGLDTTDDAVFTGSIAVSDVDGPSMTVTLGAPGAVLTSGGVPLDWTGMGSNTLVGSAGGNEVIRVVIDDAGHYTVSLSGPVDHPVNPTEDALSFVVPVIANDSIASASGQLTITIEDDRPELAPFDAAPILTVDETNLSANATASFANVFVPTFGADGAAVANAMTFFLDVKADGAASGLFDTATGRAIVLHLEGGQVVGRAGAGAGDPVAFIVSVNADGEVTLDQQRAVVHPTADPNEPVTLAATNLVSLLLVATDGDGDTAKVVVEIGKNLVFLDDGPAVTLTGAVPTITVDESNLALNAPGNFAAMFTAAFGADGPAAAGAMAYSLGVNAGASGLVDTVSGQAVILTLEAGQVVGRAGTAGPVVFLISLDASGMAVLDQQRSVLHSDPNNANDTVGLAAANLVTVTATATDLDGDHAQVLANVGQSFRFQDDAPYVIRSLNPIPTLAVDESNLASDAQASFASVFVGPFGSDGPAAANALTYALGVSPGVSGLTDAATGQAVVLSMNAGMVQGRTAGSGELVFTLAVNASGVITLDQVRAVVHPNSGDANEAVTLNSAGLVTLTATATDSEGDHASATTGIGQSISFHDDGPAISVVGVAPALVVDETSLATDASVNFADVFNATFGADGAGQVAYALTVKAAGADSGLIDTASGQHVVLSLNAGVVEGHTAGSNALVFTVKVDSAGVVTLDQLRALDHPDTGNANDGVSLAAADLISLTATITDKDGDHSSASLDLGQSLIFRDDAASLGAFSAMTVVSGAGATANGSFAYTPGADGHAGFTVTGPAIAGITYTTTTVADGVKLSGMADPDGAGGNAPVTVFTYTVHNDGTTQFQLVNPQVGTSNGVSLLSLTAGGPSSFVDTPNHRIEFTGSGSGINSSSQGFGVGNQFVGNGESFTIEFHSTGTAGNQAANVDPELVSSVTLKNDNINGSLTITWTAFNDTDGTSQTGTKTVSGSTTLIDPTIDFNRISIVGTGGSGQGVRFVALDYGKTVLPADIDLSFQIKAIDHDGDVTSSSTQFVHVNATPPIVLDLDGDGLEFQTTDAGVHYDYNGDGHASATAWVGAQDGLLAYDHDGNGLVTGGEINFAVDGSTDLEGLRLQFDSNADGKLTAADADFGKFGVWQDANANGVTDAGEFKSLAAMGIAAINLTTDGKSYVTGEGQVLVSGQASYTRADGSTGLVGDVSFATRESEKQTASTAAVANSLVAAAMIAGAAVAVVAVPEEPVHSSSPVSMVAVEEDTHLRALDEAHGQVQAQDGVLVRATIEADAGPISSASHAEASSAQAHAAEVAMSADTAPSALAEDSAPVQAGHALPMLVSAEAMPAIPAQLIAAAQAAQTAAHPGQAATLAEVLADALGGGAHNGSSIDTLLANLPSAQGATEAHLAIAQAPAQLVEMMHVQVAAPATAYEMATMSPDAVHPLTNG